MLVRSKTFSLTLIMSTLLFVLTKSVLATNTGGIGGLDKVNTFIDSVLTVLNGVSIGVVTVAIMWAGYKFLFKQADLAECGKILAGGLLIGGAAELAKYLLQ